MNINLVNKVLCKSLIIAISFSLIQGIYAKDASQFKIGVVDVQAAILQTDEGKAKQASMRKEVQEIEDSMRAQETELKKLIEEFQSQQTVLSESDKLIKQKEIQTKNVNFQDFKFRSQEKMRKQEIDASQQIFQNMLGVIKEISEPKDLDAVFDKGAGIVLYAKKAEDLTPKVVAEYNKKYKAKSKVKGTN
ncbi:OmpH family outer membrane protein [Fluviispira multicolorata]|uniref:Periplasmic chaperone for outer membrane proteins Skp n=1 Tax=Fluviispira multicolorata TaxID=2654512 RepID=A0A833JDE5_9BACT|nr:OmpH family outer membrane protein [Fluviispira multicolorata]KAB8028466.1 hypothetical protein GCL57_12120 [Fluviispira multicolorata]